MESLPALEDLIDRLKVIAQVESDAALSRWLGKTDSFIGTCRNRRGINIEIFIPRLTDDQLMFVLRGRKASVFIESEKTQAPTGPAMAKEDAPPPINFSAAFNLLGQPPEEIADMLEATPGQVESWIQRKSQPSHRQLALLFNLVATAGLAVKLAHPPQSHGREGSSRHTGT